MQWIVVFILLLGERKWKALNYEGVSNRRSGFNYRYRASYITHIHLGIYKYIVCTYSYKIHFNTTTCVDIYFQSRWYIAKDSAPLIYFIWFACMLVCINPSSVTLIYILMHLWHSFLKVSSLSLSEPLLTFKLTTEEVSNLYHWVNMWNLIDLRRSNTLGSINIMSQEFPTK